MTAWWPNHIKHPELVNFYKNYEWIKTTYAIFFWRVMRGWESMEDAISFIRRVKKPRQIKWLIDDKWRECTRCLQYKERRLYHYSKTWPHQRTNDCIECRTKMKKEYRERTNGLKDKELRDRKRKLDIWDNLVFYDPIIVNWNPREVVWEVIEYKKHKWYKIHSKLMNQYRWLDTNDNHGRNENCKRFYRL